MTKKVQRTKTWRVAALPETTDKRPEGFVITAFRAEPDGEGHWTTPFLALEGINLSDPNLTPAQAERLAGALVKAAKWVRVRR